MTKNKPLPGQIGFDGKVHTVTPRFLAFADVHLGTYRMPIRDSIVQTMAHIELLAIRSKPDVIFFAGDAFRHGVPSARDVATFGRFLSGLAEVAEVIAIPGNHDIAGHDSTTLDVYDELRNVSVIRHPQIIQRDDFQVCCIPWLPSKALSTLDIEAQSNKGAIKALVALFKTKLQPAKPSFLLGHLTTLNAKMNESAYTIMTDDVLWTQDMFDGFDVSILGHIHKPQEPHPGVYYTGSVHPFNFGDADREDRSVLLGGADITRKKLDTPIFIQIEAGELFEGFDATDCYVQILKDHGDPDPEPPLSCRWYEIKTRPPRRDFRQRLGGDVASMAPEKALETWLKLEDQDPEPVFELVAELMEGE
jgi:exonuclease SbcD